MDSRSIDESGESESDSDSDAQWIDWFLSQRGNHLFCEIDPAYIFDRFNLTNLNTGVTHYQLAIDLITDSLDRHLDQDTWDTVDTSAKYLYGMIHARYILTQQGMTAMVEKLIKKDFGTCPRVLCRDQGVIPVGITDVPGIKAVRLYCPRCEDVYVPFDKCIASIDGAYFTTSLPHLIMMAFPTLIPQKNNQRYVPRIFGFKIKGISDVHKHQELMRLKAEEEANARRIEE